MKHYRTLSEAQLLTILLFAVMILRAAMHLIALNDFGPDYVSPLVQAMLTTGADTLVYSLVIMLIVILIRLIPKETQKDKHLHNVMLYCGIGGYAFIIIGDLAMLHLVGYDFEWHWSTFTQNQWIVFGLSVIGYCLETFFFLLSGILVRPSGLKWALIISSLTPLLSWAALRIFIPIVTDFSIAQTDEMIALIDDAISDICGIWVLFALARYPLMKE